MSFKLFGIEFDGKKDSFEEGSKKMNKVCEIVGEKFMEKKWLNKNELKEYVGFSIGKIDSMMRNNEISYSKVGKNVRFDKNEVDNLLNSKVL